MKKITYFYMESCPFCKKADRWVEELIKEYPEYGQVEIERIEEGKHKYISDKYDYYYVPAYYVGLVKVHEGAASKSRIKKVFDTALEKI